MGSWNETCGLSQLPIKSGEKVVLFLLEPTRKELTGGMGYCYNNDFYRPVAIPVYGIYNDYGAVEGIYKNEQIVFNMMSKRYEQELDNLVEGKRPKNLEALIKLIERSDFEHLSFVMFHERIYQNIIDEIGTRVPYQQEKTYKEILTEKAHECINKNKEFLQKQEEELKNCDDKEKEFVIRMNEFRFKREIEEANSFARTLTSYEIKMNDWYTALLDEPEDKDYLNELVNFHLILTAMSFGRKTWMPQTGSGSQSDEMMIQKTIANSIIEHEESYKSEVLKDWDEDYVEQYVDPENITRETIWIR